MVGAYVRADNARTKEALAAGRAAYRLCSGSSVEENMGRCSRLSDDSLALFLDVHHYDPVLIVFGPVLLGWLAAYFVHRMER